MCHAFKKAHSLHLQLAFIRHNSRKAYSPTKYCVDLVRANEHENFLCTLLLPNKLRAASFAIRAYNIEVAKAADEKKERDIIQLKLKFWDETLESIYRGEQQHHPVALELSRVVSKHNLTKRQLKRLLMARYNNLNLKFDTIHDMEVYCEESVSPIYYLLLQISGVKSLDADHCASHLGKSQGLSSLLRCAGRVTGRLVPLPSALLSEHRVSQESILRGYSSEGLSEVAYAVASSAKIHLDKARALQEKLSKEVPVLFLPAIPVHSYLRRLQKNNFDLFDPELQRRNPFLSYKLIWNKLLRQY